MPTTLSFEEVKKAVKQQLQQNPVGVLATAEGNNVTARQMMFLSNELAISFFTLITSRKFKQIESNKMVAIVIGTLQIEGIATLAGPTSDPKNAGFLEMFKKKVPEVYELYKNEVENPETLYQLIEVEPKRIGVYYPLPNFHLDVMNVDEQTAVSYDIMEATQGKYT